MKASFFLAARCVLQLLLWFGDFLDHDPCHGFVPSVCVTAALETRTISDHHTHAYGPFTNPLAVSPNLTVLVYIVVCSAMESPDGINCFDSGWVRTFYTIESEVPTLAASGAVGYSEIAIKLHLQGCLFALFNKDTILKIKENLKASVWLA